MMSSFNPQPSTDILSVLKPREREALDRKILMDQSNAEIAKELGLREGGVRSLVHRAKRRLFAEASLRQTSRGNA